MTFYHATTRDRIESIRRLGLGGLPGATKSFPDCPDGVYLAADPMLALGFLLELAMAGRFQQIKPAEALAQFCVIVIDDSRINTSLLSPDPNILQTGFWLYAGVVDITALPVISAEDVTNAHFKLTAA